MAQDWTTLRVSEDAKAQAEQNKRDDESWSDYLLRCSDNPPQEIEVVPADDVRDALSDDLRASLSGDVADAVVARLR